MKHVAWLLIVVVVLIVACADDIVVPPQSEIRGFYTGKFVIVEDCGSANPTTYDDQYINWTFSDQRFWLELDTIKTPPGDRKICDFSGFYKLESNINFNEVLLAGGQQCNQDYVADGEWSFINLRHDDAPDTIRMEPILIINNLCMELILVKEED